MKEAIYETIAPLPSGLLTSFVKIRRVCKNVNIIAEIQLLQILLQTDT